MVMSCRIFKRPHHRFTTTHDRGASQFNWAPIFPWLKTFCILFLQCKRFKLGLKFLYLPNFGFLLKTVPPQWTGKLHDRNFRLTRRCFSLFWEVSVHTFNSSLTICLISSFKGLDLNFEHSSTSWTFLDLTRVANSFNLAKFKAESTWVGCCKITWSRISGLRPRTKP